jgi:hypothetical protein
VREHVDERQFNPEELLRPSVKAFHEAHVAAVKNIAEQLYFFPTPDYPHFRTFVNEPETEQKLFTNLGRELEPDIVVLEWPEKLPRIVAEVATLDMLTEENARVWALEARLKGVQFYLYVPSGHASDAKKLLKKAGAKNVGLRTWRNVTGLRTIDIAAIR